MNETCCARPQLASLLDDVALTGPDALYATKKVEARPPARLPFGNRVRRCRVLQCPSTAGTALWCLLSLQSLSHACRASVLGRQFSIEGLLPKKLKEKKL